MDVTQDIVYCHSEENAEKLFEFYRAIGYQVGLPSVKINTGTHGDVMVKKIEITKRDSGGSENHDA